MAGLLFFLALIFLLFLLIYRSIKVRKNYKIQSKLIQQKIEELRMNNELMENKKTSTLEHSNDVNQIVDQVSDLHQLVMKKYLK